MDYTVGFLFFHFFEDFTMKQHKDIFFEINPVIAERFLESSEELRASGLKTTKSGKAYVFIKPGYLAEALELVQIIWQRMSLEAQQQEKAFK